MLIKIFTLKFSEEIEGFDYEEVKNFMAGNEIIEMRENFFIKNYLPYWSIMFFYNSGFSKERSEKILNKFEKKEQDDYRKYLLTEQSKLLYKILKSWRYNQAKQDGVPPYILFTNIQLAKVASMMPKQINQFSTIDGIGSIKTEKYGKQVLEIISTFLDSNQINETENTKEKDVHEKEEVSKKGTDVEKKEMPNKDKNQKSDKSQKNDKNSLNKTVRSKEITSKQLLII